ncbi:MAG: LysR family transcriptional regulator [Burkholderiales bacterium]|nr:LysR family transcriptional regulator [Burkholderiales bacterium]
MRRQKLTHLHAWQAFEAAARHSSFVRAAEELGVTAAAVSQHVKTVEEAMGVQLFARSTHGVTLTAQGSQVFPGVRDGFARLADAIERLEAREFDNVVRISAPPSFASRWLLPRIHRFVRQQPTLVPSIDASALLTDFVSDNIDVAVRYGGGQYPGLRSTLLVEEHVFPVCSPRLLKNPDEPLPLQAIAKMPLVHDTLAGTQGLPTWADFLRRHGVQHPQADGGGLEFSPALAIEAAVEGHGVALGRRVIVADDLAIGRLARPFREWDAVGSGYYLVMPGNVPVPERVRAFVDWVEAEARMFLEAQA